MFKITAKVQDAKLAKVLRLLDGQVYDLDARPATAKLDTVELKATKVTREKRTAGKSGRAPVVLLKLINGFSTQRQPFSIQSTIDKTKASRTTVAKAITRAMEQGSVVKVGYGQYQAVKRNGHAEGSRA